MEVGVSAFMTVAMLKWFFPRVGRSGVSRFGLLVFLVGQSRHTDGGPGEVAGFGSNFRVQAIHAVNAFRPLDTPKPAAFSRVKAKECQSKGNVISRREGRHRLERRITVCSADVWRVLL